MNWFICKGDSIKESEPMKTSWKQDRLVQDGRFDSIHVTLYELDSATDEPAPLYFNRHIKQHAVLNPKLDLIQLFRIPIVTGADGEAYYEVSYKIYAVYFSAHCEYTLWHEGKNYGTVKVDYV